MLLLPRYASRFLPSLVILFVFSLALGAQTRTRNISPPLSFEENQGQAASQYPFLFRHNGVEALFLKDGVDLQVSTGHDLYHHLGLRLLHGSNEVRITGAAAMPGRSNYLLGQDASHWIQGVKNYASLEYTSIYPGIDLVFYGNDSRLEHDFRVAPGGDASRIALRIEDADSVGLDPNGNLQARFADGSLILQRPVAYQSTSDGHVTVEAAFALAKDGTITFQVGQYDHTKPLIIDPALSYATYLDRLSLGVAAIATDNTGATYVAGYTFSSTYGVTSGAFETHCASCAANAPAVFITKLDPTGTSQLYSTFLGGSAYNQPFALTVDGNGNAIVVGYTQSSDFPVKNSVGSGALNTNGFYGFVSSLKPDGNALNYSSLFGGGSYTIVNAVTVDASGNAYIAGYTNSPNYPATPGAFNEGTPHYPAEIGFITKFAPVGSLVYSALIGNVEPQNGGEGLIGLQGIAVDAQGSAYITGSAGTLWPTTPGAYQTQIPGVTPYAAPFITKLSPDASTLTYSTFLGTGLGTAIAVDSNQNVFVTGRAGDSTFPLTSNAYLSSAGGCCAFLSELNPSGSQLLYSTFIGSTTGGYGTTTNELALDANSNLWLAGSTSDRSFPLLHPLQSVSNSNTGFISEFDPTGTTLKFSTLYGGASPGVSGLAIDASGIVHFSGTTVQGIYTTPGAFLGSVTAPPQFVQYTYGYAATIDPTRASASVCLRQGTTSVSFYYAPVANTTTQNLAITNCGQSSLTVQSVQSSVSVFTVPAGSNTCAAAIAPGSSCTIGIAFTPTAAISYSGTLTINSNASVPTTTIAVSGIGAVPVASLQSTNLNFGEAFVGQTTSPSFVFLSNAGYAPLTVNLGQSTITGDFAFTNQACPAVLQAQQTCLLNVTFSPTQPGTRTGVLTLMTNDPVHPALAVTLSGTAFAAYPLPTITSLGSPTVLVSSTPAALTLYGTNFFPSSIVRVNGQPQQTTFQSNTTLYATIDPSLLLQGYGELPVTVFNPAPGGGESLPLSVTLYQTLPINPSFLVAIPNSTMLYAAIPASATQNPNTVIPVDPVKGTLGTPIPVGNDPHFLSPSTDGNYLYVALRGDQKVQRINLQTGLVDRTFPFSPNPFCNGCSILAASDLQSVPGSPQEVVLAQGSMLSLFNDAGLVNYTPNAFVPYNAPSFTSIAFAGNPAAIYSLPFTSIQNPFFNIVTLDASGIHFTPFMGNNYGGNNTTGPQVISDGSLLYTSAGQVWDPATKKEVGTFPVTTSYPNLFNLTLDKTLGSIEIIGEQNYGGSIALVASAYGIKSLTLTGTLAFPQVNYPYASNLVRWGSNGLAFIASGVGLTDQEIYLTRSSIIAPFDQNPAPMLASISPSSAIAGGPAFTLSVTGSNFLQTSTVFWNGTPLVTTFGSATQLTAAVPPAEIASSGTASVLVANPAPGGGTSSSISFTINPAAPALSLSASSLLFNTVAVGTTSPSQNITLTNTGNATLNLAGISTSGDFYQANTCGTQLVVAVTCSITVNFKPSAAGQRAGTLTIMDNAAGSPQTVALSGTGGIAVLAVSPQSLSFGTQALAVSSTSQAVTIQNTGTVAATALVFAIAGANQGDFAQSSTCGATLAAGTTCTVNVTFTPTATMPEQASLSIMGSQSNSPQAVALSGTGATPAATIVVPAGSSTATVAHGQPATYSLSANSIAGFSGQVSFSCSNLPAAASCTFTPGSLNLSAGGTGSVTLTIVTEQTRTSAIPSVRSTVAGIGLFAIMGVPLFWTRRRRLPHTLICTIIAVAGLGCGLSLAGCGGSTPAATSTPVSTSYTSAGTYTISIIASTATASTATPITLVVQ